MSRTKVSFLSIGFLLLCFVNGKGQNVAINEDGSTADASALLHVQSTTKGLLAPRMSSMERTNINPAATGLVVYDTEENDYYFYNGSNWIPFGQVSDLWGKSGSDITNLNTGNISLGTGTAEQQLHIFGNMKITDTGNSDGKLFIGTTTTDESNASSYSLLVGGSAIMTELKINLTSAWPDYVFTKDYPLMPISELDQYIQSNGHLPGIPSASQIEAEEGFHVGDIQRRMLEKIEELTLYMIDLKKENESLKTELNALKSKIQSNEDQ